jgi:hypothetical protein
MMTAIVLALVTILVTILFSGVHLNYKAPKGFSITGLIVPALTFVYCCGEVNEHENNGTALFIAWLVSLPIQFIISLVLSSAIRALYKGIS